MFDTHQIYNIALNNFLVKIILPENIFRPPTLKKFLKDSKNQIYGHFVIIYT